MKRSSEVIENISVDLEKLAQIIQEAGRPMLLDKLVQISNPEISHVKMPRDHFKDQPALVKAIQDSGNTQNGTLRVLTLLLPDGTERYKVLIGEYISVYLPSGVLPNAIDTTLSEKKLAERKVKIGPQEREVIRDAVRKALRTDQRFAWMNDEQEELYCLKSMLPPVEKLDLAKIAGRLPLGLVDGEPIFETTEDLVKVVWGTSKVSSDVYALRFFALSLALKANGKFKSLGKRWVSAEAWWQFTRRENLPSPHIPTDINIPKGVNPASRAAISQEIQRIVAGYVKKEVDDVCESDQQHADITLSAYHFYEGWLPLTKPMRCLFQNLKDKQIRLYPQWEEIDRSFRAWIDLDDGQMWLPLQKMYDSFHRGCIYPGAYLRLSHRAAGAYNITTLPSSKQNKVRVWRMRLVSGKVKYFEDLEPRRYKIDDDVYVADVRFEDLDALFQQAEEAGNSIFGLMYERAVKWWNDNGRQELQVTVDEMFERIHFDKQGRETSEAAIAWELWRRLAFELLGGGKYRFRPEYGAAYVKRGSWGIKSNESVMEQPSTFPERQSTPEAAVDINLPETSQEQQQLQSAGEPLVKEASLSESITQAEAIREETLPTKLAQAGPSLREQDFRNEVKGTTWRRRENVAGALAQKLSNVTPYTFKSNAIYRFTQVHIVRLEYYNKHSSAKFMMELFENEAWHGFYIEKSDTYMDNTWDWRRFVAALSDNVELQKELETSMRRLGLYWDIWYGKGGGQLAQVYAMQTGLWWYPKNTEQGEAISWENFTGWLRDFEKTRWHNVYLGTCISKEKALAAGSRIVDIVTRTYRSLLPLYIASIRKR